MAEFNGALFDSCDPASPGDDNGTSVYGFDINAGTGMTSGLGRPEECFKIDAKPDWLSGYSVEFTPHERRRQLGRDPLVQRPRVRGPDLRGERCRDRHLRHAVHRRKWKMWPSTTIGLRIGFDTRATDDVTADEAGGDFYITDLAGRPCPVTIRTTADDDGGALWLVSSRPSGSTTTSTTT